MKKVTSSKSSLHCTINNLVVFYWLATLMISCIPAEKFERPNVIVIMTDDQGYGDMGALGNDIIQTPNLDLLHDQSIRFTDFHVATTCAPTRSGLMTGLNCHKAGVWHTIIGRSLLWPGLPTIADIFSAHEYRTAIFGKWHLGDNYPFRPQDRGFQEVLVHGGGGVWQGRDYWDNNYFDDTYYHNGKPEKFTGYCTDVWFENAIKFIEENKDNQFFCYLATNAPHGPFHVSPDYSQPYENNPEVPNADFYGMISNIDENVGKLNSKLTELGLYRNTILIFMTDNGTAAGVELDENGHVTKGYNAGMRGMKGSEYDGGHRVPMFIRWPAGGIDEGRDMTHLSSYTDVLPTLIDLCELPGIDSLRFDGQSLKPVITGEIEEDSSDRIIIVDTQRIDTMKYGKNSSVMTKKWRLVKGEELYNMEEDPGQTVNVVGQFPEVVTNLSNAYDRWWEDVSVYNNGYARIIIGASQENPSLLTSHDIHPIDKIDPAWNHTRVRNGHRSNGFWAVTTASSGTYRFSLYRYPPESGKAFGDSLPLKDSIPGGYYPYANVPGVALDIKSVAVKINGKRKEKAVPDDPTSVSFVFDLPKGEMELQAWFTDEAGHEFSAYYVRAESLD